MPKSENLLETITRLNRLIARYNRRRWGYFDFKKPLYEQKNFSQFMRLALTLRREHIRPNEFLEFVPYRQGRFFPAFFNTVELHQAIEKHNKFRKRKTRMADHSVDDDKQFLKEMASSTGKSVIYLINFFWNDLHAETRALYERFHNDYFLSADL